MLEPARVIHRLEATTKTATLMELVHRGIVQRNNNTELGIADEARLVRVLEERERMGSTGIKDGLAIPHGKVERLDGMVACLGLSEKGIDFGAADGKPSQAFVLLLAPEHAASQHLKALARISRIFSDATLVQRLLAASSAADVFDVLANEDEKYG
jgi:nitrogen PTS system EIIA component